MRVTILDYGTGNIHSIAKALTAAGGVVTVETEPVRAIETELFVLPGVGSFSTAAERLAPAIDVVRNAIISGLPTLGICLGMQLLFESSEESSGRGLAVFKGRVTRVRASRNPQIGWNSLEHADDPAVRASALKSVYYANGFACRAVDTSIVTAWTTHETDRFPAMVRRGSITGVQFHPEKSSARGVDFLREVLP